MNIHNILTAAHNTVTTKVSALPTHLKNSIKATLCSVMIGGCTTSIYPVYTGESVKIQGKVGQKCEFQSAVVPSIVRNGVYLDETKGDFRIVPEELFSKKLTQEQLQSFVHSSISIIAAMDTEENKVFKQLQKGKIPTKNAVEKMNYVHASFSRHLQDMYVHLTEIIPTLPRCFDEFPSSVLDMDSNKVTIQSFQFRILMAFFQYYDYEFRISATVQCMDGVEMFRKRLALLQQISVEEITWEHNRVQLRTVSKTPVISSNVVEQVLTSEISDVKRDFAPYMHRILKEPKNIKLMTDSAVQKDSNNRATYNSSTISIHKNMIHTTSDHLAVILHEYIHAMFDFGEDLVRRREVWKTWGYFARSPQYIHERYGVTIEEMALSEAIANSIHIRHLFKSKDRDRFMFLIGKSEVGEDQETYAYLGKLLQSKFQSQLAAVDKMREERTPEQTNLTKDELRTLIQNCFQDISEEEIIQKLDQLLVEAFQETEKYYTMSFSPAPKDEDKEDVQCRK